MLFTKNLWESFIWFFWTPVLFPYVNTFVIYIVGILLLAKSENKAKHMFICTSCSSQYNGVKQNILSNVSEREDVSALCGFAGNLLTMNWLPVSCLWSSCPKERYGPQHPVLPLHQNAAARAEMVPKDPSTWKEGRFVFSSAALPHGRYFAKLICQQGNYLNKIHGMPLILSKLDRELSCGCVLLTLTQWAPWGQRFSLK